VPEGGGGGGGGGVVKGKREEQEGRRLPFRFFFFGASAAALRPCTIKSIERDTHAPRPLQRLFHQHREREAITQRTIYMQNERTGVSVHD